MQDWYDLFCPLQKTQEAVEAVVGVEEMKSKKSSHWRNAWKQVVCVRALEIRPW